MLRDRMNKSSGRMPVDLKQILLWMVMLGLSIGVILALSPSAQAAGNSIYVAPGGNNNNSGAINQPLKTIQAGVDRAGAGDTVYVRAGTYVEAVRISRSGTSGNPITVRAYPGETPVIDGQAGVDCLNCGLPDGARNAGTDPRTGRSGTYDPLVGIEGDHVVFEGFVVKRSMGRGIRVWRADSRASNITVRNNQVLDSRFEGILMQTTENILIENNVVWHSGSYVPWVDGRGSSVGWPYAIAIKGGNYIAVRGNTVYENWAEGIGADTNTGNSRNIIVEDNVVYDNFALQIYIHRVENMTVQRNLIYHTNNPDWRRGGNPSSCIVVGNESQFSGSLVTKNIDIINNVAVGCRQNFAVWSSDSQVLDNFLVAHNTFVNAVTNNSNIAQSIFFGNHDYRNFSFENNIVYQGITTGGHEVGYADPNLSYAHNLWHPHLPENGKGSGPGDVVGQEPQFADPRAYELPETWSEPPSRSWFQVRQSSPVLDAGKQPQPFLAATDIEVDIFQRLRDSKPDLGVHEYGNIVPVAFLPVISQ